MIDEEFPIEPNCGYPVNFCECKYPKLIYDFIDETVTKVPEGMSRQDFELWGDLGLK